MQGCLGDDTEQQLVLYGTAIVVALFYIALCLGLNTAGIMHMIARLVPSLEEDLHSKLAEMNSNHILKGLWDNRMDSDLDLDLDEELFNANVVGAPSLHGEGGYECERERGEFEGFNECFGSQTTSAKFELTNLDFAEAHFQH